MSIEVILYTLIASVVYMLVYWLPKRIDTSDPQKIDMKKVLRTVIWGLILGIVLAYMGLDPKISVLESWQARLMGYGVLIAIVDKSTLFVWRAIQKLKEKLK